MNGDLTMKLCLVVTTALTISTSSMNMVSAATTSEISPLQMKRANAKLKEFALKSRQGAADIGFSAFKASVYKEPFPGGLYIVNGDTPIGNDNDLRDFYRNEIVLEWKTVNYGVELIVDAPNGKLAAWDNITKNNLTYCVSKSFGNRYQIVVDAMHVATEAWEIDSDISYKHIVAFDDDCNADTNGVIFDVRPVNVSGKYLARAFFPRSPRVERNILVDETSFTLRPEGKLQLAGILRHELGHTLGFRHEQTRAEAGACFEDKDWIPLTSYDKFSVMHYPQCNGLGDWSLVLTDKDKLGAACLYGSTKGGAFDKAKCKV